MENLEEDGSRVARLLGQAVREINNRLRALEAEVFPDDGGGAAGGADLTELAQELEETSDTTLTGLYDYIVQAYVILAKRDPSILAEIDGQVPGMKELSRNLKKRLKARGAGGRGKLEAEAEME